MDSNAWIPALLIIAVLAFIGIELFLRINPRFVEADWRELAQRTGLKYSPPGYNSFGKKTSPSLSGTYRGYEIVLHRAVSIIGYNATAYTRISLAVKNPANGYMLLRNAAAANVQLKTLLGRKGAYIEDKSFRRRFFIEKNQPADFASRVLASIDLRRALERAFGDTTRRHIELAGQRLKLQEVWDPSHTGKRNLDYLLRHFDALVDLAEAIENTPEPMGQHPALGAG